jgi:MoaA/NifB/PqqE/SkfB family radical SAM enzyme
MQNRYNFPLFYWHLELASKCALECPRCPRTGPENKSKYQVTEMPLEKLKLIFTPELLKDEVKRILLCGGQGDPIYYSKLFEFISYVKQHNRRTEIVIITNGSHRKKEWWQTLSNLLDPYDSIVFSVDGWDQESNSKYRKGSDYESIMLGLETMLAGQATVHWSTIIFSFNQDHLSQIENIVKQKGVHYFHRSQSTKFGTYWADVDGVDHLMPRKEFLVNDGPYVKSVTALNPKKAEYHDLKSMISQRQKNIGLISPGCLSGDKGLYIDASGLLYACSWISHPFDMPLQQGQKNLWLKQRSQFNVFERSLEEVLNDSVWNELFESWKDPKKLYATCKEKCACISS